MISSEVTEQTALAALAEMAAELTGFSAEAVRTAVLKRLLRQRSAQGESFAAVVAAVRRREQGLLDALQQAVSVGETYFFRHPEQFRFLIGEVLPDQASSCIAQGRPWRAWSAGCATGEEAYTLAGCARAMLPRAVDPQILGTDLLERNVKAARQALYGRWSVRSAGPELIPILSLAENSQVRVVSEVQALTRFEQHNLLEPPPGGPFDVVLCRNVLVYLSPEAASRVISHLIEALAPDGVLLFGPMDLAQSPEQLSRCGPAELQVFQRRRAERPLSPPPTPARSEPARAPVPAPIAPRVEVVPPEPIVIHLRALALIERGADADAETILEQLCDDVPDYVPGLAEHALLLVRRGAKDLAAARMREVLRLVATLPEETALPGPEPLPAQFYVSSAEALLERLERTV